MKFEVHAKANNANDFNIFMPVESLDEAFKVAEQQKNIENCYVFIVRIDQKYNYPFPLHKWQRCEYNGVNEWHEKDSFTFLLS